MPWAGNVLVPVDAAGRVLELLLVLEAAWAAMRLSYGLALLSPVAFNALEFAKSQLEWMAEGLTHSLEARKTNPFALRCAPHAPALNKCSLTGLPPPSTDCAARACHFIPIEVVLRFGNVPCLQRGAGRVCCPVDKQNSKVVRHNAPVRYWHWWLHHCSGDPF